MMKAAGSRRDGINPQATAVPGPRRCGFNVLAPLSFSDRSLANDKGMRMEGRENDIVGSHKLFAQAEKSFRV